MKKIAIIGGGFSALSLSAQIISKANAPLSLYIFEKHNQPGLGTAYSTPYPWHLLNVRASQMGILAEEPEGFYDWLQKHQRLWRESDPAFKYLLLDKEAFLPRKLFGIYLSALLKEMQEIATHKHMHFEIFHNSVVDIEKTSQNELSLISSDQQSLKVDKVVLATGVQAIKELPFAIPSKRYIGSLWELPPQDLQQHISNTHKDSVILIIGTALTMIDMVTSLEKLGYPGKIIALSRHGLLPAAHQEVPLPPAGKLNNILLPKTLLTKLSAFRKELAKIEKMGGHWSQLFEKIRPSASELWKQLSISDQKHFLKHLLPLWNRHRHRMAPESLKLLDRLKQQGRLKILAGKITHIHEKDGLEICYAHNNITETLQADFVYNCTGPNYSLKQHAEPLIQRLLSKGWIMSDTLGLGVKTESSFCAAGPLSSHIYVMGSLLFGERFETTAVPEIKNHAKKIASHILAHD